MSSVRFALSAALVLSAVACSTVQPVREPAQFIPQAKPELVVVIYNDNAQVPVQQPRMSGDTLMGTWAGIGEPVAVPLSEIARIDAVQPNRRRTTFLIAGLTALTIGGVYAIIQAAQSGPTCDGSYQPPTVGEGRCVGEPR